MNIYMYRNYFFSLLAIVTVYVFFYVYLDIPLALAAHTLLNSQLFHVSKYITHLGDDKVWIMIAVIGLAILGVKILRKQKLSDNSKHLGFLFLSILIAVTIGSALKIALARYRPELLFQKDLYGFHFLSLNNAFQSTPSGHSLCIFAVCTSLSLLFKRYAGLLYLMAILVGISRLILTKHYLSDVMLGAYVGIISAVIAYHIFNSKYFLRAR